MSLLDLKAANLVDEAPSVDDIIVCGMCATLNVITLLGTRVLTEAEFAALHDEEKRDLSYAMRAVKKNFPN